MRSGTYLCTLLLHKFKISPNARRYIWLCNTNIDDFNSRSIACAVSLNSFFHCFINLKILAEDEPWIRVLGFLHCTPVYKAVRSCFTRTINQPDQTCQCKLAANCEHCRTGLSHDEFYHISMSCHSARHS